MFKHILHITGIPSFMSYQINMEVSWIWN